MTPDPHRAPPGAPACRHSLPAVAAVSVLALLAGLGPAAAQQAEEEPRLRFSLDQTLRAAENYDLDPGASDRSTIAATDMMLAWREASGGADLAFDLGATLRGTEGTSSSRDGLRDPFARFSWRQESAATAAEISLDWQRSDLSSLRRAEISPDDPDRGDLSGGGTRETRRLETGLELRRDAPLSFALGYSYEDTSYGGDGGGNVDFTRQKVSAGANLAFDPLTTGHLLLSWSQYDSDGAAARETPALSFTLDRARPAGLWAVSTEVEDRPEGTRHALRFGQDVERPEARLSWRLGYSGGEGGGAAVGRLSWQHDLPAGSLRLSLNRDVTASQDTDQTQVQDVLVFDWRQDLSERDRLSLGLGLARDKSLSDDSHSRNTYLTATWSRALTEDWQMSLGYEYRVSRDAGEEEAHSNSVFLGIGRDFVLLP